MCEFNLLDPAISSFEFGESTPTISTHNDILESDKPDKHMEYFWMTFKDSIIYFIGKKNAKNISTFSDMLNVLQKERQYETITLEISKFMKSNIDMLCKCVINSRQTTPMLHLHTNITRWKNIDPTFQKVINESILIQILLALSRMIKKGSDKFAQVLEFVVIIYTFSEINVIERIKLFEYAVKNNICSIAELLLPTIDLKTYFKEDIKKYKNINIKKLIKEIVKNGLL